MNTDRITLLLILCLAITACVTTKNSKTSNTPDGISFKEADARKWVLFFHDPLTENWKEKWTLDGEVATAVTGSEGIDLTAGKERKDSDHMVLWTKDEFEGDVKIEYEFTRLDTVSGGGVNILYIQATGSGQQPYKKDIAKWAELRREPAMKLYFDRMNTYHISYSAYPNNESTTDDYIRARRYMPHKTGLKDSDLKPDYFKSGFFQSGVPHKFTVIKKDRDIYMRISNAQQTSYFHWHNDKLPIITEGRIGLRLMWTRASRFKNFKVSVPRK